ncbi:MAG: xanthine phosphoribosyltransferase [Candidatus Cloacimonadota bacterium]|nr:MAG: xanthine phosphoribosyltransferase [Candidatus Cloacimonadota bacterium]PIE78466.1 MAG: xanthine phosphoribosyltransferase [Candidatus Delongbacteria bacterium]
MRLLKDKILKEGIALNREVLKVDSFLNHQIDPILMKKIGEEFSDYFKNYNIDKIVTIETSGVVPAVFVALNLNVPLVFAKKSLPGTLREGFYSEKVFSFTKNKTYDCIVSKKFINSNENILIIDDFLAHGNAALALSKIIEKAEAKVSGIGIVIEKGFQQGRSILEERGYEIFSLARIEKMDKGEIVFFD